MKLLLKVFLDDRGISVRDEFYNVIRPYLDEVYTAIPVLLMNSPKLNPEAQVELYEKYVDYENRDLNEFQ